MVISISITIISPVDCFGIAKTADLCWIANANHVLTNPSHTFDFQRDARPNHMP